MYTTLDMFEIKGIYELMEQNAEPEIIDLESILCNIYGNTFFDIC